MFLWCVVRNLLCHICFTGSVCCKKLHWQLLENTLCPNYVNSWNYEKVSGAECENILFWYLVIYVHVVGPSFIHDRIHKRMLYCSNFPSLVNALFFPEYRATSGVVFIKPQNLTHDCLILLQALTYLLFVYILSVTAIYKFSPWNALFCSYLNVFPTIPALPRPPLSIE